MRKTLEKIERATQLLQKEKEVLPQLALNQDLGPGCYGLTHVMGNEPKTKIHFSKYGRNLKIGDPKMRPKDMNLGPGYYDVNDTRDSFFDRKKQGVLNMIRFSNNSNLMNSINIFAPKVLA